jgi:hypothetical protein
MTTTMCKPITTLLLLALIIVAIIIFITTVLSHGYERHGIEAIQIDACLRNQGPISVWHNPTTNRFIQLCQVPGGKYGLQVSQEDIGEITAFIKDKMSDLQQVTTYLRNRGYELIKEVPEWLK